MEAIVRSAETFPVSGHLISKRQVWTVGREGHLRVLLLRVDEGGGGGRGEEAGGRTRRHGGGRAPLGRGRPYSFNGLLCLSYKLAEMFLTSSYIHVDYKMSSAHLKACREAKKLVVMGGHLVEG